MKNKEDKRHKTHLLKSGWARLAVLLTALALPLTVVTPAFAAGDASFSLSPASGSYTTGSSITVKVYATASAGDNANAVQANLTFAGMTSPSVTVNSATFSLCIPPYSGNSYVSGSAIQIPCAATSSFNGTQLVATLTFTASTAGSPSLTMTSGSDIQASGNSVFNGTLPSASFTVANAPSGGGGGTTGGGGSTGGGSTGGTKTGGTTTHPSSGGSSTSGGSTSTSGGGTTTPTPTGTDTTTSTDTSATAALTIVVTDSAGKPIENAKVVVDGRYSEYTDSKGTAGFTSLPVGSHTVAVSASGKATTQSTVTLAANDSKQVPLKLASAGTPMLAIGAGVVALVVVIGSVGLIFAKRSHGNPSAPNVSMSGMVVGTANAPAVHIDSVPPSSVVQPSPSLPPALSQTPPELPQTSLAPTPPAQPVMPPAGQLPPAVAPPTTPVPPVGPLPPQQ